MAKPLLSDELWRLIEPLLPRPRPRPEDGRQRVADRAALTGILFVLPTGLPLAFELTAANVNDDNRPLALVDAIPPGPDLVGRPRRRPLQVQGVRAYGSAANRPAMKARGIEPVLARPMTDHGSGLGVTRWVVARTHCWFQPFRRLRVRFERLATIHEAFHWMEASLIRSTFLGDGS